MADNDLSARLDRIEARLDRLERGESKATHQSAESKPATAVSTSKGNSGKVIVGIIILAVVWWLAQNFLGIGYYNEYDYGYGYGYGESGISIFVVCIGIAIIGIIVWALRSAHIKEQGRTTVPSPSASAKPTPPTSASWENEVYEWVKREWLMKVGALLLLLALVWFVRYAFLHNWIGPVGRIAAGLLVGVGILVWGNQVMPKRNMPGQVLVATGTTMFLVTMFAARYVYGFFTPGTALAAMALVVVATAVISVIRNAKWLAVASFIGGAIAPLLTDSPVPNYTMLLAYVLALDVGVLIVVSRRGWRSLIILSLLCTLAYSTVFDMLATPTIYVFIAAFYLLFFAAGTAASYASNKINREDLVTVGLSTALLIWWTNGWVAEEWQALVMAAAALFSMIVVYRLFARRTQLRHMVMLHAAAAATFIGAALAFELHGPALTIAWSLEAVAAVAVAWRVFKDANAATEISLVHIVPVLSAFDNGSFDVYNWIHAPLFNEHFFVVLIVTLSLAGTAWMLWKAASDKQMVVLARVFTVVSGLSAVAFVWLVCHLLFATDEVARGVSLVLYSVAGVGLFFNGIRHALRPYTIAGGVLLGGVVVRLFLVEVWEMPLAARIVTFVVIGALLVSTAFYQKKHAH